VNRHEIINYYKFDHIGLIWYDFSIEYLKNFIFMKKQLILYVLALVITVAAVSVWAYQNSKTTLNDGRLVLYYRDGCVHCANVEKFMAENGVKEKIVKLEVKEGAIDRANADEMLKYAKKCQIPLSTLGFPFLWTGSSCLMGDVDIIDYFSGQIKSK